VLAAIACAVVAACGSDGSQPQIRTVDLIKRFGDAEKRPVSGSFELAQHTLSGTMRASIDVPVPSRIIWSTHVPRKATLNLDAAVLPSRSPAVVRFRIGVSDHRIYEALFDRTVTVAPGADTAWSPVSVDLSAYAGRKWSIFYQPDRVEWRLVLSTDKIQGAGVRAVWGEPGIDTDVKSARGLLGGG